MRATVRFRNLSNAVPPPKLEPSQCACEGWIEKKISTSGPSSGKWRKRYCLLFQEYLYMFRYDDGDGDDDGDDEVTSFFPDPLIFSLELSYS